MQLGVCQLGFLDCFETLVNKKNEEMTILFKNTIRKIIISIKYFLGQFHCMHSLINRAVFFSSVPTASKSFSQVASPLLIHLLKHSSRQSSKLLYIVALVFNSFLSSIGTRNTDPNRLQLVKIIKPHDFKSWKAFPAVNSVGTGTERKRQFYNNKCTGMLIPPPRLLTSSFLN